MILNYIFSNPTIIKSQTYLKLDLDNYINQLYGSVYFLGGCAYLKEKNFTLALINIVKGLMYNPLQLFDVHLYPNFAIKKK